jgi:hypothetical protein
MNASSHSCRARATLDDVAPKYRPLSTRACVKTASSATLSGGWIGRFVEGRARGQKALFPECLDGYVNSDNAMRVIDVFGDELDLLALGFSGAQPALTGRSAACWRPV